jgi:hypothetical protein
MLNRENMVNTKLRKQPELASAAASGAVCVEFRRRG